MMISPELRQWLLHDARQRFLRYVTIHTTSDDHSGQHPSSAGQWELARILCQELRELGIQEVALDEDCYLYVTLPASPGVTSPPISFCAHLDTSPSESGEQVKPVIHEAYDGGTIRFPDAPELLLTPEDSPQLRKYVGQTIITASGTTLLGADDKAGVAEIMTTLAALQTFPDLPHPEMRVVFTPDEEIGQGTQQIDLARLGQFGYTIDGGEMGELEDECFHALRINLTFHGRNVHPGEAKNRMVNAAAIAARFFAALPEHETPEHTELREGFFHLTHLSGDENRAICSLILRDFDGERNMKRVALIEHLIHTFHLRYDGLRVEIETLEQYRNMQEVLRQYPAVVRKAEIAIEQAGLTVIRKAIRGGTDGSRLSFLGLPTPNIFSGGLLYHSKKEWIPEIALQKAAEVMLHLCALWAAHE
ncbi:peptidase T [Candidatus Moduliflexus flocculans]|uniref:Peptidase T n=1 Tax=Candidatus Moduliflexus flocculans TaxID=1499966 RepID=A0A081BTM0_9BACT|nr:peptidase T [Candidatus Moduliflexus flocculans]